MQTLRDEVLRRAADVYGVQPDFPWDSTPDAAVLRHPHSRKWFALLMRVSYQTVGIRKKGQTDILNIKCDPLMLGSLLRQEGLLPAYHMSKSSWMTVLLDGTVSPEQIFALLHTSFCLTKNRQDSRLRTEPKTWLVPANPKYYDVQGAFAKSDVIDWKQGKGILAGDTVLLYVGAPVSSVLFECLVTKTGIPYHYADEHLRIEQLMEIQLLHRFPPEALPLSLLREFGVTAIRGPRSVPEPLLDRIRMITGQM